MTTATEPVEYLPLLRWRCGACGSPMRLLGVYTELGGVLIQHSRNRHARGECAASRAVVANLLNRSIITHCPNCHSSREVHFDRENWTISEGEWRGAFPVACDRPGSVPPLREPL